MGSRAHGPGWVCRDQIPVHAGTDILLSLDGIPPYGPPVARGPLVAQRLTNQTDSFAQAVHLLVFGNEPRSGAAEVLMGRYECR